MEKEIEITPEMITAADAVLEAHYIGSGVYDMRPQVIEELYVAMRRLDPALAER